MPVPLALIAVAASAHPVSGQSLKGQMTCVAGVARYAPVMHAQSATQCWTLTGMENKSRPRAAGCGIELVAHARRTQKMRASHWSAKKVLAYCNMVTRHSGSEGVLQLFHGFTGFCSCRFGCAPNVDRTWAFPNNAKMEPFSSHSA